MKKHPPLTKADIERIRHLIEVDGLQQWKVAEIMQTSVGTIEKNCKKYGLKTQRVGPRSGFPCKGGTSINRGYRYIYNPNHPNAANGKYVFEHRLKIEEKIGRFLSPSEVVHHINGNKLDNRIENLVLFSTNNEHLCYEYLLKIQSLTVEGRKRFQDALDKIPNKDVQPSSIRSMLKFDDCQQPQTKNH
jgi:predicted transcriptional regulator